MLKFTGERIVPEAKNCEPNFAQKMYMEHSARYRFAAQIAAGRSVLDIGCGVGYGSALLSDLGAANITSIDLSEEAIEHARSYYARENISFSVGNAEQIPHTKQFDLITCFELIEHVPNPEMVLDGAAAALTSDGVLIISTPRAKAEKRNNFHIKEFTADEFAAELKKRFQNVKLFIQNNRFSSQVTDGKPRELTQIHYNDVSFLSDDADYFVAVASNTPIDSLGLRDVSVFTDDSYVLLLEQDVEVLHDRRKVLERDVGILHDGRLVLERDIGILRKRETELSTDVEKLRSTVSQLENALRDSLAAAEEMRRKMWRVRLANELARTSKRLHRSFRKRRDRWLGPAKRAAHAGATLVSAPTDVQFLPETNPDILWVIGAFEGESKRYRVFNPAEVLRDLGYTTEVVTGQGIDALINQKAKPKAIILFRIDLNKSVSELLNYAAKNGIPVFFDVDDLVFDETIIDKIHGYHLLPAHEKELYVRGVKSYRRCMEQVGSAILSTEPLEAAARPIARKTFVLPNTVNRFQIDTANVLLSTPRQETRRIAYFSGSRTHNEDFKQVAPALARLMAERADVRLLIVGHLDLDDRFAELKSRIDRLPFMNYREMLHTLRQCDINLAPLAPNNPFNEAKSELKWFEAALVETPTVATPTPPYAKAIVSEETGFLADTDEAWYDALSHLLDDAGLRERVGKAARAEVLNNWGPDALRDRLSPLVEVLGPPAQPARGDRLRIDWIVPGLLIGGGGHRNILRAAYFLEQFGHDVGLVFTDVNMNAQELRATLHKHFYPFKGRIRVFDGVFQYSDYIVATHWTTVYPALEAAGMTSEVVYFVQDFEPMFAPMGSEYIKAENTYRKGLYAICSGPWCAEILKRDYAMEADFFEFPLDRAIYYPRHRTKSNLNVLFFAKPEMPRRCYELGVEMLTELKRILPEVEVRFYGSRNVDLSRLPFEATALGMVPTLNDLAQAYSNADLGVVFSTTNPSLVPYEFMACGTPVVDLDRPGNEINYGGRRDIALLGDPDPREMAKQVAALLLNPDERARRAAAGVELVSSMPDEEGVAKLIETLLLRRRHSERSI